MDSQPPSPEHVSFRVGLVEHRQSRLEWQSYALYGFLLALVVAGAFFVRGQLKEADRTEQALCAFRTDLQRRSAQSRQLLENNPQFIRALGLTPAQVRQTLTNQDRTIRALRTLHCPAERGPTEGAEE